MFRAFGYYGMFPMVVVNQVIFQKLNRRHGENAMIVAEEFVTGRVGDEDCLAVLSLQFAGALFCSFFFIVTAQDVFLKTKPLGCLFKYTVSDFSAMLYLQIGHACNSLKTHYYELENILKCRSQRVLCL